MLPWAVFPLGLRPVFARNHFYCTLRWVIFFLGLRPVLARNQGCCNARYFLCSLGVLSATIEFCEISRHVRVGPCYSVATIRNIFRCIVTGVYVVTENAAFVL
ncbi:hypothetical protein [Hoylesella timonensis]|uniref:hypothetical protein n=1 Tax=Hoylesella timonensis TaxID=386414 RepID=UPI0024326396|nr:hypothetical protein [Hoylesella timonensis]